MSIHLACITVTRQCFPNFLVHGNCLAPKMLVESQTNTKDTDTKMAIISAKLADITQLRKVIKALIILRMKQHSH